MQFVTRYVDLEKKDDDFSVRPIGDIHVGNQGFNRKKFEKDIMKLAKLYNFFTIGMGDYIDNIMAWAQGGVDKRWNPETVERDRMTTDEQAEYFTSWWKFVADKCWGMLSGNHEWKTISQQRFKKEFCHPIDPNDHSKTLYQNDYLGRMCIILLKVRYKKKVIKEFQILALHGGDAGMRQGGVINRLEDIASSFELIDLGLMGHSHTTWTTTLNVMSLNKYHKTLNERKMILASTGTYLNTYTKGVDSYIESSPRRATRAGNITVTFNAYHGDIFAHD